jgi:hypothetical protein
MISSPSNPAIVLKIWDARCCGAANECSRCDRRHSRASAGNGNSYGSECRNGSGQTRAKRTRLALVGLSTVTSRQILNCYATPPVGAALEYGGHVRVLKSGLYESGRGLIEMLRSINIPSTSRNAPRFADADFERGFFDMDFPVKSLLVMKLSWSFGLGAVNVRSGCAP